MPHEDDVTGLLVAWGQGDRAADSRLIAVVYQDLRRVARRRLRAERADHSLAPTALVHEAYLRLVDLRRVRWQNRAQFFAIAARLMRQILVDHARAHVAAKRGGAGWKVPLADDLGATMPRDVDLLDLDVALEQARDNRRPSGRLGGAEVLWRDDRRGSRREPRVYLPQRSSVTGRAPGHGCSASCSEWSVSAIRSDRAGRWAQADEPSHPHHTHPDDRE